MACVCWGAAAKYTADPMLGQRRRRFVSIELAMGWDAGPTLNRNWVGRPTSCVRGGSTSRDTWQHDSLASIEWMLASTCGDKKKK